MISWLIRLFAIFAALLQVLVWLVALWAILWVLGRLS